MDYSGERFRFCSGDVIRIAVCCAGSPGNCSPCHCCIPISAGTPLYRLSLSDCGVLSEMLFVRNDLTTAAN